MSLILALLLGCPVVTDADVDAALDRDGDGFVGAIHGGDDCNDDDARIYPGAPDPWYDGVLLDCDRTDDFDADADGLVFDDDCDDDDPDVGGPSEWFVDADFDNSGAGAAVLACDPGPGWAPTGDDCDDANSNFHPLASERCNGVDDDCDGFVDDDDPTVDPSDFVTTYEDLDGDGVGAGASSRACVAPEGWADVDGDCDDGDANNTPGADERCDGVDNDCDGLVDDDDVNLAVDEATWYIDDDNDGFGDDTTADPLLRCLPNEGEVNVGGDCNDDDPTISPGVAERCDGIDNDCDGVLDQSDPDAVLPVWYLDVDGDGVGDSDFSAASCLAPDGYVPRGEDCDDNDADLGAPVLVLADEDGDGYGSDVVAETCSPAAGAILEGGDCNDDDPTIKPGADDEPYDGIDQDCSGTSDYDADLDGQDASAYGGADCNDDDPATYDGAPEVWYDGIDQDCRGGSDNDADLDGYDAIATGGTDCDDTDPATWPNAPETWGDGIDQDCGVFDDLDVDMNGLPDMDGCTTVARLSVPGDETTLANAVAAAADCTEILLGSGDHDAVGLNVGNRRLLIRSEVDDAVLLGAAGQSMFRVGNGYVGLANLEAVGGTEVVNATGPARVVLANMWVRDNDDDSYPVFYDTDTDVPADLWMRFSTFEHTTGIVHADAGVLDLKDIVALEANGDFETLIDVHSSDLTLHRFAVEGGVVSNAVRAIDSQIDLQGIDVSFADAGALFYIDGVAGSVRDVTVRSTLVDEMRLHTDVPGALVVRDVTITGCSFRPFSSYGLLWLEGTDASHITIVGNDISGPGFSAITVDENYDGTELSHVVVAGNLVDHGIWCSEPTPVRFSTIAGNSGGGAYSDCQLDHSVVAHNGTYGLVDASGLMYTNVYGNGLGDDFVLMVNPVGVDGNIAVEPGFLTFDPDLPPAYLDLHLRADSPLRDAGDPALLDVDGTVADIGAYGGPDGEDDLYDGELDGLPDRWELLFGLDPAIDDALLDLDGDGLDNLGEYLKGTRPDVPDTDADLVLDLYDDFPFDPDDA